ncbi:MAG: hypothetical protein CVV25_00035 [Ignavibacteriae bacterium HGW-Ignavibacteriae-4]|nr:MAG: hypothetical protein CVV25_00035 [Ignavibacteriae bacterium HGW-Ignavibacteriae-4]
MYKLVIALIFISFSISKSESVLDIANKELTRNFKELQKESTPPYYISYNITDIERISINSSFGNLMSNDSTSQRILDIDLRVGDYKFDNTHIIRGSSFNFGGGSGFEFLPLDNNANAIKNKIWYSTDKVYKEAIETYEKAKSNAAVKVEQEDKSADFSKEKPVKFSESVEKLKIDRDKWVGYVKQLSNLFNSDPLIYDGSVSFQLENKTKYFVNTEGSQLKFDESSIRIFVYAKTKATDGMSLPLYESYFAFTPETLPPLGKIEADILKIIALLKELREAPLMDTYSGPAILSGEASGVFFHEIFGHRVEGHREKDPSSSQTFKKSVGESILPDFIDVVFDPTIKERNGTELSGYFLFDDQGVKSEKVVSVNDGIFRSFLMARSPIEGFDHSNGHGRKQAGYNAVSRQSNLIVESSNKVDDDELVELLRKECKKQEKEFGLYFKTVQGGFTFTGRTVPNAFNVLPLEVYKIYTDGRANELVRGVDLIGTPLSTFSNILATSERVGVFNGICGAESGGVPVSASSPDILVSKIEVQKKKKSQAKPPILEAPKKVTTD